MALSWNLKRDSIHKTDSFIIPIPYWYDRDKGEVWYIQNDETPARRNARRKYLYWPAGLTFLGVLLLTLIW